MENKMSCIAGSRFAGKNKIFISLIFFVSFAQFFALPLYSMAEVLSSPNYSVEDPQFDYGGGIASSTNFQSRDSVSAENDAQSTSTNYKVSPGVVPPLYPGVPGQPTITNTGGQLYNALDVIVNTSGTNQTDTNYAIAISPDNFATITNFVQADDTPGTTTVWQTYVAWGGGSGQRITGLNPSTTYTIKVKARYGPDSETAYSITAQAATVAPYLTMSIAGVSSGTTVAGATTNISTNSGSVAFGPVQPGTIKLAAQNVIVATNALGGYSTTIVQNQDLTKTNGVQIPAVAASNASPAAWPGVVTSAAFGYHTTGNPLCSGTTSRFSANNTFAAASTTPFEIACSSGAVATTTTSILFKLEIEALQPSGDYQNLITYVTTSAY